MKNRTGYTLYSFGIIFLIALTMVLLAAVSASAASSVHNATGYVDSWVGVFMREAPSTSSGIEAGLFNDSKVTILEEKFTSRSRNSAVNKWYKVRYEGKTGYIRSDLIDGVKYKAVDAKASEALNYRTGPSTSFTRMGTFGGGSAVKVLLRARPYGSSETWYKLKVGKRYYYSSARWISLKSASDKKPGGKKPGGKKPDTNPSTGSNSGSGSGGGSDSGGSGGTVMTEAQFEKTLSEQGFPADYKAKLRKLHRAHPRWVFVAKKTGIKFADAVNKESKDKVSLINYRYPKSWRDKGAKSYIGKVYIPKDGLTWFNADRKVVEYYMDPRNFLNDDRIYMFENLRYSSYQSSTAVSRVISGTALSRNGYSASMFVRAGKANRISPIHLAARAREEVGGGSIACSGYKIGETTYYNPFNINATTGANPVIKGMIYAKQAGWNTRQKAINGAARILSSNYLKNRQHTLYYQRFNVANGYSRVGTHQYMTNILAPYSEAYTTKVTYRKYGIANEAIVFEIPVYNAMPKSTSLPK